MPSAKQRPNYKAKITNYKAIKTPSKNKDHNYKTIKTPIIKTTIITKQWPQLQKKDQTTKQRPAYKSKTPAAKQRPQIQSKNPKLQTRDLNLQTKDSQLQNKDPTLIKDPLSTIQQISSKVALCFVFWCFVL